MTKNYSKFSLHSYKKVLPILLFVMLIIPKNVFAFTVTYKSMEGMFENGTTENIVEYDENHNIVSGEYMEPAYIYSCGDKYFTKWFYDLNMDKQFYLRDETEDVTVYAGYNRLNMCFDYSGRIDSILIRNSSNYKLETWGAQGGNATYNTAFYRGGYGAYATGSINLSSNTNLYLGIGGQGGNSTGVLQKPTGGFNGGRNYTWGNISAMNQISGASGGATHIATEPGLLSELEPYKGSLSEDGKYYISNEILLVSGAGSGGYRHKDLSTGSVGANAGGIIGQDGTPRTASRGYGKAGSQTAAGCNSYNNTGCGAFGLGGLVAYNGHGSPGGAGFFGGGGSYGHDGVSNSTGAGGSSYIANPNLYDKYMAGVSVTTSDETETKTISVTDVSEDPLADTGKMGNGYAKITLENYEDNQIFYSVTFKHEGEEDFVHYVKAGEKINKPNVYLDSIGYDLHVWEIEGTTTEWNFDDPVTEDMVLKTYHNIITYNINYNSDGGELETGVTNPNTYTVEDDDITLINPTKEGYTFKGWTGTDLSEKTMTVTIQTGSIGDREYTAHWTPIEYTITYDLDGGELETGVTNPDTYTIESNDITLNNPVREGYTFLGWTGSNGTTPTNVLIPTGSTGNKTYKANYKIDRHTAIFDSNLGEDAVPETITKDYNEELGTLPTTSRRGYIFEGWFTGKTDGTKISSTTKMPPYNPTYYAHWTPITYTMRFNSNGGEGTMSDEVISYGTSKALTDNAFTKEGYTFAGWNSKADGTGTNYINKQEVFNLTDVDGTVFNLYAVWTKDEYIISYNLDGGQVTNPVTTYSIDTEDFNLVNPTKAGYTFTGWTGSNGTVEEETVTIVKGTTGNKEYTAHYKAVDYNITYLSNNDDATVTGIGNPVTYTVEDSNIILNNPSDPDTYHYFVGWTTNLDTEEDLSMNYTIDTSLIKDITVYAVYQTSPYTVYFDSDGGNEIDPISREGTEDVGVLPIPKKEGYKFKGWFVNNILIDETFHSRVDVTAVAKWEKIDIPVDVTPTDNPKTGDNILKHVMLLVISLIGLGISTVKFKLKLKTKKVL